MKKENVTIPTIYVIAVIFIAMKLDGIIDWKWIYVIFPIWGSWITTIIATVIAYLIDVITDFCATQSYKRATTFGKRLVWDSKANEMYGGPESEGENV